MASEIVSTTLDADYPVAGVDNDTQGFRDNFNIIKTGLSTAASEITQLQDTSAKLNESNDFNGSQISDAELAEIVEKTFFGGAESGLESGVDVTFANGHYQTFTLAEGDGSDVTFNLTGWPQRDGYAKMTVALKGAGVSSSLRNILITSSNSTAIKKSENYPTSVIVDTIVEDPTIIEFWTVNQGATIYANYLGVFA